MVVVDVILIRQQLQLDAEAFRSEIVEITPNEESQETEQQKKKKRKRESEQPDADKPKTPLEIQREMDKWARRQEKIKMTFKQPETTPKSGAVTSRDPTATMHGPATAAEATLERIKKPWAEDDDEEETPPPPPDAVLPGRMRNVGLPLNYPRSSHDQQHRQQPSPGGAETVEPVEQFNEEKYVDRAKRSCLLCRRQFPNVDTLEKHMQMSQLHKTNVAEKQKELQAAHQTELTRYRDRAKERRQHFGLDPSGLARSRPEDVRDEAKEAEAEAAYKAAVPLDETNIGNKMLKSMGWSEGRGLGRNLQGIVNPVVAEQRVEGVGLGAGGSRISGTLTHKERNRIQAIQRYKDLAD